VTDRRALGESAGATNEFRRLFDDNASYVWSSLRRLGVPEKDRDDLTQEVFMTVHALLDDYDRARPFRPWAFGIAYRVALRHRRKLARGRESPDVADQVADDAPSADDALVSKETRELVQAAIGAIEIHRRAVFILKEIDGIGVPEIAEALALPLNTAYSRLRLARDDFRGAVKRLRSQERSGP
jgi:RNA polymerase sigma-70 factor, ECF subfamily